MEDDEEDDENRPRRASKPPMAEISKEKNMTLEERQRMAGQAKDAMIEHEMRRERFMREENEEHIKAAVAAGDMTQAEAQKLMSRKHMHDKGNQEKAQMAGLTAAGADFQTTEQMLEELLDIKQSNILVVRCCKKYTGLTQVERAVAKERYLRKQPNYKHAFPCIQALVHTNGFELFIGAVMITNGITIGMQASTDGGNMDSTMTLLENIMTGIFVMEILLRIMSDGWTWIWNTANTADSALIVITGVLPLWILAPAGLDVAEIRSLQVLRVVRLARLVRMVRTLKMFRTFWKLIQGILDSATTLFFMYVLLGTVLYTFGIFSVYWIGKEPSLIDDALAQEHFGDVPKSMITLFQVMTMDSWTGLARELIKAAPHNSWRILFILCAVVMICSLVLLNLVMAVIVNNAFKRSEEDQELLAKQKEEEIADEIQDLRHIFKEIDQDESGFVSKREYMDALDNNDRVKTKFGALDIGDQEARELWDLLDTGEGEVSVDHFADTLRLIQGDAKAKDSYTIVKEVHKLNKHITILTNRLDDCRKDADDVRQEITRVHRQLGGALLDLMEFVRYAGRCIPPKSAVRSQKALDDFQVTLKNKIDALGVQSATPMGGSPMNKVSSKRSWRTRSGHAQSELSESQSGLEKELLT